MKWPFHFEAKKASADEDFTAAHNNGIYEVHQILETTGRRGRKKMATYRWKVTSLVLWINNNLVLTFRWAITKCQLDKMQRAQRDLTASEGNDMCLEHLRFPPARDSLGLLTPACSLLTIRTNTCRIISALGEERCFFSPHEYRRPPINATRKRGFTLSIFIADVERTRM
jgi:hypothetical protein